MRPNMIARICEVSTTRGRAEQETSDVVTVTCEFLYGGLAGGGCIGVANGARLEDLVSIGSSIRQA